jgi:integrase
LAKRNITKAKEPVRLRFKKLNNGNQSIYLDIYTAGKRSYEFLKLYLTPETTPLDKESNRRVLELANAIKSQRIVDLQNNEHGFSGNNSKKQKMLFCDYIKAVSARKTELTGKSTNGIFGGLKSLIRHITQYKGDKITFKQIDKNFCIGFIDYLRTVPNKQNPLERLGDRTQFRYITTFKLVLNSAIKDDIINDNPFQQIPADYYPKNTQAERPYLTTDELAKMINTPCVSEDMKKAFLFSCFTGLRVGDITALQWGQIQTESNGTTTLSFVQQKTKKSEHLPLCKEALKYLPERKNKTDNDLVFYVRSSTFITRHISLWACSAGVTNKRVTFHTARHTHATLLLNLGVPIEVVSKILGHSNIQTTQIYAKIIDKSKGAAMHKLDDLFGNN